MAVLGSFVYGTGVVYGPVLPDLGVGNVTLLSKTVILVEFSTAVVVTSDLLDPSSYTLQFSNSTGSDAAIRRVLPHVSSRGSSPGNASTARKTLAVELVVDALSEGVKYTLSVPSLRASVGAFASASTADVVGRRTKVDRALSSLPPHYDSRPESLIRCILTAIGKEDDVIGGSERDG